MLLEEYSIVFVYICFATLLAFIVFGLSYFLVMRSSYAEKISAYECGFDPFSDTRSKFDVRFYLVAILFIIFDLEIVYMFPWVFVLGEIGIFGFSSMMLFLLVLTVGFCV